MDIPHISIRNPMKRMPYWLNGADEDAALLPLSGELGGFLSRQARAQSSQN